MLEAVQRLGPEIPETAATIAIQKVFAGDPDGRGDLEAVLSRLAAKTPFAAIARGVLGMTTPRQGGSGGRPEGASGGVERDRRRRRQERDVVGPGRHDRLLTSSRRSCSPATRPQGSADPALAAQAARDLEDLLKALAHVRPEAGPGARHHGQAPAAARPSAKRPSSSCARRARSPRRRSKIVPMVRSAASRTRATGASCSRISCWRSATTPAVRARRTRSPPSSRSFRGSRPAVQDSAVRAPAASLRDLTGPP